MVLAKDTQEVTPEETQDVDNGVNDTEVDSDKATEDVNDGVTAYKELMAKKGFKSEEDFAESYSNLESHKGKLENENKDMRNWISDVAPFLQAINTNPEVKQYIEEKLGMANEQDLNTEDQEIKPEPQQENEGEATPKEQLQKMYKEDPKAVQKLVQEMVGSQVKPLQEKQTRKEVQDTLKEMRSDKEKYPYFNKDTEKVMTELLRSNIGKKMPVDGEGIKALYEIAVSRQLDNILKEKEEEATNKAYENIKSKEGGFMESDEGSATGNLSDEDQAIIDGIMGAGSGKSLI